MINYEQRVLPLFLRKTSSFELFFQVPFISQLVFKFLYAVNSVSGNTLHCSIHSTPNSNSAGICCQNSPLASIKLLLLYFFGKHTD